MSRVLPEEKTGRRLVALVAAGLVAACASIDAPTGPDAGPADADSPGADDRIEQTLYRVTYRGIDGRGRLRLVLRRAGGEFQLAAADPFGRALWSFGSRGGEGLLLDHRETAYCRVGANFTIEAVALSELPVRSLPRLLTGRLPAALAEPLPVPAAGEGEIEVFDLSGRRWSARFGDGALDSWTLYEGDEPVLWWQRRDRGGILSHRDGAQAIWVRTAEEVVRGELEPLEPPPGYDRYSCVEADGDDLA